MGALDPNTEKFYQGKYLSEVNPKIDREAYSLPLEESITFGGVKANFSHLIETQNVEDLLAFPEDFQVDPFEVQAGTDKWDQITIVSSSDEFTRKSIPNFAFYNFYLGSLGKGFNQQPTAIAIDAFYIESVELC